MLETKSVLLARRMIYAELKSHPQRVKKIQIALQSNQKLINYIERTFFSTFARDTFVR